MIEGPAPGNSGLLTSLRSEAYGLLAGISFLNIYVTTYAIAIPTARLLHLYSDNLGLVLWVTDILQHMVYPRMYVRPEADVLLQIEHELSIARSLNFVFKIEHVKGHQDDHCTYNELSRQAPLNVCADQFATNFLRHGKQTPYDELCNNPVSLYIENEIITRNYNHQIRSASCSSAFREYLIKKYDWTDQTPDLIWWQAHGKSIATFSPMDQRRIRKYIFSWLPTNKRLFDFGDSPTSTCPSCHDNEETQLHLIQCRSFPRAMITDTWLHELNKFLSETRYTPPYIKEIFNNHLIAIMYPLSAPPPVPEYDTEVQKALSAQNKIGWHQLLYGRLSIIWGQIIGRTLSYHHVDEMEMTIDRWGKTVISLMFTLILRVWKQRNSDGHQLTEQKESQLSRQRIIDKIVLFQESNKELLHCDRKFVICSMDILEQYSIGNLLAWYRAAKSIFLAQKSKRIRHPSVLAIFPPISHLGNSPNGSSLPVLAPHSSPARPSPPPEPDSLL